MAFIGDSITEHNEHALANWLMYIENWTGADIQNLGISGTNFHGGRHEKAVLYREQISKIDDETKLIGVAASFNNIQNLELGKITDSLSDNTICGYINDLFDDLKYKYPKAVIICYCQSRWGGWHPTVKLSDEYVSAVEAICENKGIPFFREMYDDGNLDPFNSEYYTADNYFDYGLYLKMLRGEGLVDDVHPNSKGYRIIVYHLLQFILENIDYE